MSELTLKLFLKATAIDAHQQAKALGRGWCRDRFLRAIPVREGDRAGILWTLRLLKLWPTECDDAERLRLWLDDNLPLCTHKGEDGEPSMCISEYHETRFKNALAGAKMLDNDKGGFHSLLDALRNGGEQKKD